MSGPFTLLRVTAACAGECRSLRVLIGSDLVHTHISEMPASKLLEGAEGCIVSDGELAVTNSASNVFSSNQVGSRPNHPSPQEQRQEDCELQPCVALHYRTRHEKENGWISYLSDAAMKRHDQKQLREEEFLWACDSRGIRVTCGGKAWQQVAGTVAGKRC